MLFWGVMEIFRVGLDLPTIEVRYEHVNVEAEAHVGSRALPSFINFSINIFEVIYTPANSYVVIVIAISY